MKLLIISLITFNCFAKINLKLHVKENRRGNVTEISEKIETLYGKTNSIGSGDLNNIVEFKVDKDSNDIVTLKAKIFEIKDGEKILVGSPIIKTKLNQEATITKTSTKGESLKLTITPSESNI